MCNAAVAAELRGGCICAAFAPRGRCEGEPSRREGGLGLSVRRRCGLDMRGELRERFELLFRCDLFETGTLACEYGDFVVKLGIVFIYIFYIIKRHAIDKCALTLLIMALPNDMYAQVDSLTNARDMWLEIEQQMQDGDAAVESQKENALNVYEGFRARENESLTESYHRLNTLVNDLRRLNVNVKFLKNLTQEWQNMAINIQLSQNLGALGLHDLYSMMVQHEEFITGNKSKRTIDPLALATVPHGGPNFMSVQPASSNFMPMSQHPEDFHQDLNKDFHQNYQQSMQNPNDPTIITVTNEELYNMNESLALISHKMQRLTANRDSTNLVREEANIRCRRDFSQVTKEEVDTSRQEGIGHLIKAEMIKENSETTIDAIVLLLTTKEARTIREAGKDTIRTTTIRVTQGSKDMGTTITIKETKEGLGMAMMMEEMTIDLEEIMSMEETITAEEITMVGTTTNNQEV
ncbi:hypothetical protein OSB04_002686 [Centaurea solstitialis]|uniref:Uncharacterized protein n=1 Tax=Centaurea solstitialis TaxID=347529 RepID=A0AA38WTC6_9ASTR|nr:hypothetical protein OSB04_002686 [Centaurea solstitialis]